MRPWRVPYLQAVLGVTVGVLLVWHGMLVYVMATRLDMDDFGTFYHSAASFWQGHDLYTHPEGRTALAASLGLSYLPNLNPPHVHLLILPLALLPPWLAVVSWEVLGIVCLVLSLRLILSHLELTLTPVQRRLGAVCLLGFAGTGAVTVTGQITFVLLLPFTAAWCEARREHWTKAGAYLGLVLSVKAFLLIFLPYLLLRRRFRAVGAAMATASLCFALGVTVFGLDAHRAWLRELSAVNWASLGMNASILGALSRMLGPSAHYTPLANLPGLIMPVWLVSAGLVGLLAVYISAADRTDTATDRAFAVLMVAALLISPLGWIYYLGLAAGSLVALAFQPRGGEGRHCAASLRPSTPWRNRFLLLALPGLLWPSLFTTAFQPGSWATVAPGSFHFIALLSLWCALVADWRSATGAAEAVAHLEPVACPRGIGAGTRAMASGAD